MPSEKVFVVYTDENVVYPASSVENLDISLQVLVALVTYWFHGAALLDVYVNTESKYDDAACNVFAAPEAVDATSSADFENASSMWLIVKVYIPSYQTLQERLSRYSHTSCYTLTQWVLIHLFVYLETQYSYVSWYIQVETIH